MVYNGASEGRSLMDFPRSIKECIDWLIHIHHSDKGTQYFATVLRTELSAMGLRDIEVHKDVQKLLENLNEFIGYNGYNHRSAIKGTGIGNKADAHFSSLSDEHITRLTTLAQLANSENKSDQERTITYSPHLINLLQRKLLPMHNEYKDFEALKSALNGLTGTINPSEETTLKSVTVGPSTHSLLKYICGLHIGYVSAYRGDHGWSDVCQKTLKGDRTFCCNPSCDECGCNSSEPWTMCCDNCPRRICVRVFLSLLPILLVHFFRLYTSLMAINARASAAANRLLRHLQLLTQLGYEDTDVVMALNTEAGADRRYHAVLLRFHDAYHHLKKIWESIHASLKGYTVRTLTSVPVSGTATASSLPCTIREKLIWTMGLPFTPSFGGLLKHIAGALTTLNLEFHMFMKLFSEFLIDIARIFYRLESSTSYLLTDMSKHVFRSSSAHDASCFLYESEPDSLIQNLLSYAKDVFETFTFLRLQCNVDSLNGGWKCCHFGSGVTHSVNDTSRNIMCRCDSMGKGEPCQFPLQAFLTSNREAMFWNKTAFGFTSSNLAAGKNVLDCRWLNGFSHQLSQKGRVNEKGSKGKPKAKVPALKTLCQWLIALTHREPECLGDYIAFFQEFRESGEHSSVDSHCLFERPVFSNGALVNGHSTLTSLLSGELKCTNGSDGTSSECVAPCDDKPTPASSNTLQTAIASLLKPTGVTDAGVYSGISYLTTSYAFSLSSDLWPFYCPSISGVSKTPDGDDFPVLQWLYEKCYWLHSRLKGLSDQLQGCKCCKLGCSSGSCPGLAACEHCHPTLYTHGLTLFPSVTVAYKCSDVRTAVCSMLQYDSALRNVFKAICDIIYGILLRKALETASNMKNGSDAVKSNKDELKVKFHEYVGKAMNCSKKKLECGFVCTLFTPVKGECNGTNGCEKHVNGGSCKKAEVAEGSGDCNKSGEGTQTTSVSPAPVVGISAILPDPYTPPAIDPYNYLDEYTASYCDVTAFEEAVDFHVRGSQLLLPPPTNLRESMDWILKLSVGALDNGKCDVGLEAVCSGLTDIMKGCGGSSCGDPGECNLKALLELLVKGLRKFTGYSDKASEVKTAVRTALCKNKESMNQALCELQKFLSCTTKFPKELGEALRRVKFEVGEKGSAIGLLREIMAMVDDTIHSLRCSPQRGGTSYGTLITVFKDILTSKHVGYSELKCDNIEDTQSSESKTEESSCCNSDGLKELYEFVKHLSVFAAEYDNGNGSSGSKEANGLIQTINTKYGCALQKAMGSLCFDQCNSVSSDSSKGSGAIKGDAYFTKLHKAIADIGGCASHIQCLCNVNVGKSDSCPTATGSDTCSERQSICSAPSSSTMQCPSDARPTVEGTCLCCQGESPSSRDYRCRIRKLSDALGCAINSNLKTADDTVKNGTLADPAYAVNASTELMRLTKVLVEKHITDQIQKDIESVYVSKGSHSNMTHICIKHLIRQFVQQLSSKICEFKEHLDHLKQLCQWLYRLGRLYSCGFMTFITSLVEHLEHIVQVVKWVEGLRMQLKVLNDITKANPTGGPGTINAITCYVAQLLNGVYLIPQEAGDSTRRALLTKLRDYAIDRYTLQVWNDHNDTIRDWICFKDGVVRHSDIGSVRTALATLTSLPATDDASRVQCFHAIYAITKFNYWPPVNCLEESLVHLQSICEQLPEVYKLCNGDSPGDKTLSENCTIQKFCCTVAEFVDPCICPYGIYVFARNLGTLMGPNAFSNSIISMKDLCNPHCYDSSNTPTCSKVMSIIAALHNGVDDPSAPRGCGQKLAPPLSRMCEYLAQFICCIKKEYIFRYPVVYSVPSPCDTPVTDASCCVPLLSSDCSGCHTSLPYCCGCLPSIAHVMVTVIPLIYAQLCYLCYYSNVHWWNEQIVAPEKQCSQLAYLFTFFGFTSRDLESQHKGTMVHALLQGDDSLFVSNDAMYGNPVDCRSVKCKSLYELYMCCVSYFRRRRETCVRHRKYQLRRPCSLREMLCWLTFLPFATPMGELDIAMMRQSTLVCPDSIPRIRVLLHACAAFSALLLQLLQGPVYDYLCFYDALFTGALLCDLYPHTLLLELTDYCVELSSCLRFLTVQCSLPQSAGGWAQCRLCTPGCGFKNHFCRCEGTAEEGGTPSPSSSSTCPHPLAGFLCDSLEIGDDVLRRGFHCSPRTNAVSQYPSLSTTGRLNGWCVFQFLRNLVGHNGSPMPLMELSSYLILLTLRPPATVSQHYTFLFQFSMALRRSSDLSGGDYVLLKSLHMDIELSPGCYDPEALCSAIIALTGFEVFRSDACSNGAAAVVSSKGSAEGTAGPPVLQPMDYPMFNLYSDYHSAGYLSFVCRLTHKLHPRLLQLQRRLSAHPCVVGNGDTESCCKNCVMCPLALTQLYTYGFHFHDATKLANTQCASLADCIGTFLSTRGFGRLLMEIDAFLWSIRMPFFCIMLTLWTIVTCDMYYLRFFRLDVPKVISYLRRWDATYDVAKAYYDASYVTAGVAGVDMYDMPITVEDPVFGDMDDTVTLITCPPSLCGMLFIGLIHWSMERHHGICSL